MSEQWIGEYASAYPDLARAVKTEAAIRVLLRREAVNAEKLLHSGRIDEKEHDEYARKLTVSAQKCGLQHSFLLTALAKTSATTDADGVHALTMAPELATGWGQGG